jgi:prevent-host-death family protein
MITTVNVHEAKTKLSTLLAAVERGDDVVIARRGMPIARLIRYEPLARAPWGSLTTTEPIDDAAFEAMGEDELRRWGLA